MSNDEQNIQPAHVWGDDNPQQAPVDDELRENIANILPTYGCPTGCDGLGTYPETDQLGDVEPGQCQYCFEFRLPVIDVVEQAMAQHDQQMMEALLAELPEQLSHYETCHTHVIPGDCSCRADDYNELISDFSAAITRVYGGEGK